ncbi:MAG: DUF6046 domain-containing protein [Bacteroidales bacterium]|jgi:hypothetical protein|nr:DUF6046 domain-containing protein [Bacteroidales bacterium]
MLVYVDKALGFNLPPYWKNQPVEIVDKSTGIKQDYAIGKLYQDPLSIKWEDETQWWDFPLDPVLSISGKNTIVRRNVLKINNNGNRRGSVKEIWSQDDYEIEIAGVLIGATDENVYTLRRYLEARKTIEVMNGLLTTFNIVKIAIESYSLPFTKGLENQMYTIKAYSDDAFDLITK